MKKGYLIERYTDMGSAYTTARLLTEAKSAGINLSVVGVEDVTLKNGTLFHKGQPLTEADFVINRYKYGVLKDCINRLAKHQYNRLEGLNRFVDRGFPTRRLQIIWECLLWQKDF